MNKRSRKVRGSSRRLVALVLCCVCVLAALPVYALANEAATTPSTEASVQQTAGQAPDTPPQGTDTQSADAAPNPAADVNPSNSTPADETPSNSNPADETPGNSTPADETPSNSTPADETPSGSTLADENPTEGSTQPEASAQRMVTATADGLEFSVTGDLPETTTLRVVKLDSEAEAFIRDTVLQLGDQATGAAYDITLLDNGEEIQPEGEVEVSINGLTSAQGVYHLPHTSAEDVMELVEEVAAQVKEANKPAFFSKTGRGATKAGKSTPIPTVERLTSSLTKGKLNFKTSGFSTYYVVFSNPEYNNAALENNPADDTVYMAPGTSLQYTIANNSIPTVDPADGDITVEEKGTTLIIKANPDAAGDPDTKYTVKWNRGGTYNNKECELTIYIDKKEAVAGNLKNEWLYVAVRGDGRYPGEPADTSGDGTVYSYYADEGANYVANRYGNGTDFSKDASQYISAEIGNHAEFKQSINTTPAVGIVDQSGAAIKQYILNDSIKFDKFLEMIAQKGNVTATDGTTITMSNMDQYELVPYVIKFQGGTVNSGRGWHIDCIVKKKDDVTLSYDLNIPDGYTAPVKTVPPDSQTGQSGSEFNIGAVIDDKKSVTEITVTPTEANTDKQERKLTFQGWNTNPDGTGTWYWPKDLESDANGKLVKITITENTTLYAIWQTDIAFGTGNLKIEKKVADNSNQTFTFKVEIAMPDGKTEPAGATYSYEVYNSANTKVDTTSSTIANGGTLNLAGGQYAVIKGLPSGASVTVTETNPGSYTPTWTGGEVNGSSTTTKIPDGSESKVTCTNTRTAKVTIKKLVAGNMGSHNDSFTFTVSGTSVAVADQSFTLKHGETKEITVNVGDTITVSETLGDYTASYTITATGAEATTGNTNSVEYAVTNAAEQLITFTNTYSVNIDTGVLLDTLPYLLILALVAGGVVVMLGRRRRRYED